MAAYWLQPSLMSVVQFSKPILRTSGCTAHVTKSTHFSKLAFFTNLISLLPLVNTRHRNATEIRHQFCSSFHSWSQNTLPNTPKTITMIRLSPLFRSGFVLLRETARCSRLHEWYCKCAAGLSSLLIPKPVCDVLPSCVVPSTICLHYIYINP
jgi:hypothetical protein